MIEYLPPRFAAAAITERWTVALELVQSSSLSDRLAGISALEALRRSSPEMGGTVVEVLSSFVRRRAAWDSGDVLPPRTSTEVQAALVALGRQERLPEWEERPLDLHGIALREAYLPLAHFEHAFLYDCDFQGALLVGTYLQGTWLARTNLHNANLDDAHLEGADLSAAHNLTWEQLQHAHMNKYTRLPDYLFPEEE